MNAEVGDAVYRATLTLLNTWLERKDRVEIPKPLAINRPAREPRADASPKTGGMRELVRLKAAR